MSNNNDVKKTIPQNTIPTSNAPNTADHSIRQDLYFTPSTLTPDNIKNIVTVLTNV